MSNYEENKRLYGAAMARQMEMGAAPAPAAAPAGLDINALRQRAAASGASEDWTRFQQGDVDRWSQYYDPGSGKFRSMRGAPGLFDKPTECPPGMGPSGPNETDPCTSVGYGGGGLEAGPQPANLWGAPVQPANPLSGMMQGLQPDVTGAPVSSPQPLAQAVQPFQSSLQSLIAPQAQQTAPSGLQMPSGQRGWNSTAGGLQNMLAPLQRQQRPGRWF